MPFGVMSPPSVPLRGTYSYETYNALDPRVTLDYAADQNIWELGGVLLYQF